MKLEVKSLSFSYPKEIIFNNLNLDIDPGQIVGIWGVNGIGKTTLLKLLLGILKPSSGLIEFKPQFVGKIGYLPQDPIDVLLPWKSVIENVMLNIGYEKSEKREEALKNLCDYGIDESYRDVFIKELSGGYQQRLGWACLFAAKPDVFILDEPFSMQDLNWTNKLAFLLYKEVFGSEKIALLISHDPIRLFQCCQTIVILKNATNGTNYHKIDVSLGIEIRKSIEKIIGHQDYRDFMSKYYE
ncbi:MAG: ATP-binding cassette domain-containing protein [Saprospiraceae bacterium]|nr:ATP-binding cassette domain-containing protein [Candidatus Vicinibacter affinis]MBK7696384.1 ATP-binding cassette domain-containing protein [Candidatus Vicinibacter affinis]MBK9961571.1 ATP-binding cassette domain-containing protein [Candidatus Vicinibacter affinis]